MTELPETLRSMEASCDAILLKIASYRPLTRPRSTSDGTTPTLKDAVKPRTSLRALQEEFVARKLQQSLEQLVVDHVEASRRPVSNDATTQQAEEAVHDLAQDVRVLSDKLKRLRKESGDLEEINQELRTENRRLYEKLVQKRADHEEDAEEKKKQEELKQILSFIILSRSDVDWLSDDVLRRIVMSD